MVYASLQVQQNCKEDFQQESDFMDFDQYRHLHNKK